MGLDLNLYLKEKKNLVDHYLKANVLLPDHTDPETLHESMRYSLLAPGKRIRPILCLAAAQALAVPEEDVLPIAAALEMIHVFSLIHDDLPAMDDDDLRRGQPTNHKVFGEAIAILAGDNLVVHAFEILARLDTTKYKSQYILTVISVLARATGSEGMIAGQVIDLESENKKINLERLKKLHLLKTGALIRSAVALPAILCDAAPDKRRNLETYGAAIGLAFQIADDILDIEGGKELGKDIGSDIENGKATYPALMGLEKAKTAAAKALDEALASLKDFDDKAEPLRHLARFIVERKY